MRYWGISALSHDAALAIVEDGEVLFAAHSERYSRRKNDRFLHQGLLLEALQWGPPDAIVWYERPLLKKLRQARAGQWAEATLLLDLPRRYLRSLGLPFKLPDVLYADHHLSHAAAGFATSGFEDAVVLVADSIGQFRTFTIGLYRRQGGFKVLHSRLYPHSLGLLYSAFTRRCGYSPNEDEYIIMGMAAYGEPRHVQAIRENLVEVSPPSFRLRVNVHRGIGHWLPGATAPDLAASIQAVLEEVLLDAVAWARAQTSTRNLVLAGGVALNCVANSRIARSSGFDNVWVFANPGDAGSSLGCVLAVTGSPVTWRGPYLGTDLAGEYPVSSLLHELANKGIVGVAHGRAEFGPRALGNRSLLADPRSAAVKDIVNDAKGRERFRPFAPVVRVERAPEVFDMPVKNAPYMQYAVRCLYPEAFPAVVNVDGTSRVQTVSQDEHPGLYRLLEEWEDRTGCPVLLNTSLNSRGEPLVNSAGEARNFSVRSNVAVYWPQTS